jgi:hypothetical protein
MQLPSINHALAALGATILVFMAASPVLKDKESGLLGVVAEVSWFGLFVLVPAFIALLVVTAARRRRASRSAHS